jgi:hypothetical protein
MERSASTRYETRAEELLSAKRREEAKPEAKRQIYLTGAEDLLSAMGKEDVKSETKKPRKTYWQTILMTCCCILVIAAAGKGFLYLDTEISTSQSAIESAVKGLNTLKAEVTAADTREQLVAVTAELEDLKATTTHLRAELWEITEAFETLKTRKNGPASAQRKRR